MSASITLNGDLNIAGGFPSAAVFPYAHNPAFTITKVFRSAFGSNHGVVTPVIGGEVALFVGNQSARSLLHHEHGDVLDIDHGIKTREGRGRPVIEREPVTHNRVRLLPAAITELSVEHEISHANDTLGNGIRQPVHDIDVMSSFLKQQPGCSTAICMPILKVIVTAITHKVTAPNRSNLTNQTILDNLTQNAHNRHVSHIVAHVERSLGPIRGFKNAIRTLNGDRNWLFQIDRNPSFQERAGDVFVSVIGAGDNCAINAQFQQFIEGFKPRVIAQNFRRALTHRGIGIASSNQFCRNRGFVAILGNDAPCAQTNHANT